MIETETTDENIIRCMSIAYGISNATNTISDYAILAAFPLQLWLQEYASTLNVTRTLLVLL